MLYPRAVVTFCRLGFSLGFFWVSVFDHLGLGIGLVQVVSLVLGVFWGRFVELPSCV